MPLHYLPIHPRYFTKAKQYTLGDRMSYYQLLPEWEYPNSQGLPSRRDEFFDTTMVFFEERHPFRRHVTRQHHRYLQRLRLVRT